MRRGRNQRGERERRKGGGEEERAGRTVGHFNEVASWHFLESMPNFQPTGRVMSSEAAPFFFFLSGNIARLSSRSQPSLVAGNFWR